MAVPLGHDFLEQFPPEAGVEGGAVLPWRRQKYAAGDHYDSYADCQRMDAAHYD